MRVSNKDTLGKIAPVFRKRLLQEIGEKGLKSKEFCKKVGISYSDYLKYTNGISFPKMSRIITISSFLNVSIDWLFGLSERKRRTEQNETSYAKRIKSISYIQSCGVTQQTIRNWYTGKYEPTSFGLVNIAKKTGISIDWLVGMSERKNISE